MSRQRPRRGRWWATGAGGLILVGLLGRLAAAADPGGQAQAQLQAQLAAGEFAPALEAARQAPDPAQRDAWLAQVAVAQAAAGIRDGAVYSAGEIGDDRSRAETLARLKAQAPGGMGGGAEADFDTLIQLITSTVKPNSWTDTGSGAGSIAPFPTGVWVDSKGLFRTVLKQEGSGRLADLRNAAAPAPDNATPAATRRCA